MHWFLTLHGLCELLHAKSLLDVVQRELLIGIRFHLFSEPTQIQEGSKEVVLHTNSIKLLRLLVEAQVLNMLETERIADEV